jgi:hypothetical protein
MRECFNEKSVSWKGNVEMVLDTIHEVAVLWRKVLTEDFELLFQE